MSELSDRMIRDMELAGLVEGTRREYFRAVRQLAAYYKISPDQLSERKVEDYIRMSLTYEVQSQMRQRGVHISFCCL